MKSATSYINQTQVREVNASVANQGEMARVAVSEERRGPALSLGAARPLNVTGGVFIRGALIRFHIPAARCGQRACSSAALTCFRNDSRKNDCHSNPPCVCSPEVWWLAFPWLRPSSTAAEGTSWFQCAPRSPSHAGKCARLSWSPASISKLHSQSLLCVKTRIFNFRLNFGIIVNLLKKKNSAFNPTTTKVLFYEKKHFTVIHILLNYIWNYPFTSDFMTEIGCHQLHIVHHSATQYDTFLPTFMAGESKPQ